MPTILDTLSIAQCVVSYGKEASFAGALANVSIQVTAKALGIPQLRLVWAATGDIFSSFTDSTVGGSGTPGIIVLPQTGQDGFRHGTSTFKDWYYEAAVTATTADGQQLSRTYRFQIPAGTTTLDLDTLDEDGVVTAMPAVAPVPTVTSVNGQTGAVTVAGGAGGATIDDTSTSSSKVWSSAQVAATTVTFDGTNLKQGGSALPIQPGNVLVQDPADDSGVFDVVGAVAGSPVTAIPGDSAYQVWLNAGNTGTQAQYLASLKGQDGAPGTEYTTSTTATWSGTVDLSAYTGPACIRATLTANVTAVTLPSPPASVSYPIMLVLTQDATGGRTVTWPTAPKSANGLDPVLSTGANAIDLIHLLWTGNEWILIAGAMALA